MTTQPEPFDHGLEFRCIAQRSVTREERSRSLCNSEDELLSSVRLEFVGCKYLCLSSFSVPYHWPRPENYERNDSLTIDVFKYIDSLDIITDGTPNMDQYKLLIRFLEADPSTIYNRSSSNMFVHEWLNDCYKFEESQVIRIDGVAHKGVSHQEVHIRESTTADGIPNTKVRSFKIESMDYMKVHNFKAESREKRDIFHIPSGTEVQLAIGMNPSTLSGHRKIRHKK